MSLAERVVAYRYSKGWGPDELANRAEISRTALYQIESGKTELPRAATLRRIALALDVSMDALLGRAGASASENREESPPAPVRGRSRRPAERGYGETASWNSPPEFPFSTIEDPEGAFFAIKAQDCTAGGDFAARREQELIGKLRVLLAAPLGDGVIRILEELYQSLNHAAHPTGQPAGLENIR